MLIPGAPPMGGSTMIDTHRLKELVQLMVDNDLSELDLKDEKHTVTIKRAASAAAPPPVVQPAYIPPPALAAGGNAHPAGATDNGLIAVESPMVGTFYSSPNPDAPPFVTTGASVSPGAVVCLIEAMKVFNEIKAEITGTLAQVLVKSGDPVEFGQKLFLVKPS
jgi:acetyl-CoA carboxylase biotin carboxyl carrier protein